jgi:hypothetical protein
MAWLLDGVAAGFGLERAPGVPGGGRSLRCSKSEEFHRVSRGFDPEPTGADPRLSGLVLQPCDPGCHRRGEVGLHRLRGISFFAREYPAPARRP